MIPPDEDDAPMDEDGLTRDDGPEDAVANEPAHDDPFGDLGDHDHGDDETEDDGRDELEPGYLWTFAEQEERLAEDYPRHMEILDDQDLIFVHQSSGQLV